MARGLIVNALGAPMEATRNIESPAPDIMSRRSVFEPFATGITAIDSMIPIGRGQRNC